MQGYQIKKCSRKDIPSFSEIICKTFNDKYSCFFIGLSEQDYIELVTNLNLLSYDKYGNSCKYLLQCDDINVGALEIYIERRKNIPIGSSLKILSKKYNLLKGLKTSLMLLGFGPPYFMPKNTLFIDKVGILKEHQRRGFGKVLLDFTFNKAKEEHMQFIQLDVITKNSKAISLYEKLGFKIINTSSIPLSEIFMGISSHHRMQKVLK
ncbi:MAG TPA: GNAT family N-acetyltransferase [Candidatus Bathyarchaeia archaeon]|nr:GNAT family N-acetyltransferase [Candidatus Bathyarchaeia archaeon]